MRAVRLAASHAQKIALKIALTIALVLAASAAGATDYCVDPVSGSDTASGRCADRAWATLGPSQTFPFVSGDRVLLSAGRHVHPLTQWYMKPGVSWIGAGRERTTVVYNKLVAVPFIRFRTGTAGSGPPGDLRPDAFTATTVVSDFTIVNEGTGSIGIDVACTSGDSAPALTRLGIEGFPTGASFHPASDERVAASTHAVLTNSVIRDASASGLSFFADVFYARAVTEGSTARNVTVRTEGVGATAKTQLQDLRDAASASAAPILTNVTLSAGGEAAMLLVSYYDDGTGSRREQRNAGATGASIRGSILTGAAGHGLREHSPFNEPAALENNALGGNVLGDCLDEGTTVRAASAVGTGNLSVVPTFVDRAGGDLHVLAGSPTIDRLASAPADDYDGQSRPQGGTSDLGADEWVPCAATADAGATRQAPPCTGGISTLDGTRSRVDAACTAGLSYEWWDGPVLAGTGATLDVARAMATTYRLVVRCADPALSACFGETTIRVEPSTAPPSADAGSSARACASAGEIVVFDLSGAASAAAPSVLSGTTWATDAGTIGAPSSLATTLTITATGSPQVATVTLTATDDRGCTAQDVIALSIDPVPSVTLADPATTCHDAAAVQVTVDLSAPASGGTPPLVHSWSSSEGTITGDAAAILTVPGSAVTREVDVTVTVTDARGCTAADTTTVRLVPQPVALAGPDGTACGDTGTLATSPLDGSASTGPAPLSYAWSASEGTIAEPSAATTSIELSVGAAPRAVTVTLRVSDASGACVSSDDRVVTVGPGPVARAGDDTDACAPPGITSFPLDGSASTGVAPLSYLWTTSAGTIAAPAAPLTSLDLDVGAALTTAIVTLEVRDARGSCVGTDQRVIRAGPGSVAIAGADTTHCMDPSGTLQVTLDGSASSGPPPLSFRWTASEGVIADPAAAITTLTLSGGGSRAVTVDLLVTDARGTCPGADSRTVRVSELASAAPGGAYSAVQGAGATRMPLDGATGGGQAPLAWGWTTTLGTFEDTGAASSALPSPALLVPQQPVTQRGQACLTITTADDCVAGPSCTDVVVTLVAVQPPLDAGPTLRAAKAPPDDAVLSWQEAPTDAAHDAATAYELLAADRGCGPFVRLQRIDAVAGTNTAADPVLRSPPRLRCWFVRSLNDGGASDPPAPDGSRCR